MNKNERKGALWLLAVIVIASLLPWGVKMCSVAEPPAKITVIASGDNPEDAQGGEKRKTRKKGGKRKSKKGGKKREGKGGTNRKKKGKDKSSTPVPPPRDFLTDTVPTS